MLYEARAAQSAQFVAATSSKSAAAGQKDDGSSTAVLMNNFGNAVESVATLMQDQVLIAWHPPSPAVVWWLKH